MPRRSQRDKNLEEAKHKRRLAQGKVTRLESHGVRVRKAEIAPILPLSELEGMNARQLRSHIRELERFNSRETSFVPGFQGEPLRKQDVNRLRNLETSLKDNFQKMEMKIASMPNLPGQDQTPWERATMLSTGNRTGVAGRILEQSIHFARAITSQESLEKLIQNAERKLKGDFIPESVSRRMNSIDALLEGSGYADLKKEVHKLTTEQQLILMEFTTFTEVARDRFGSGEDGRARVEKMDKDYEARNGVSRADDIRGDLNEIIQYVKDNTVALSSARNTTNRPPRGASRGGTPTNATRSKSGRRKK